MPKNPKLLIITGPTATGKTALGELIASKIKSELISADSRQVYIGMDIGTGKDHSPKTKVHLVNLLTPDQSFSSFDFVTQATKKIDEIHSKKHLPIIVGGSGFYINSFLHPEILQSPNIQNHFLFPFLNKINIVLLKNIYKLLDKKSFESLSPAEQNNHQRLVKRILLKLVSKKTENWNLKIENLNKNILHLHLDAPTEFIHQKINERIQSRLQQGLLSEIVTLQKKYKWSSPGLQTLAYQEFEPFFSETDTLQHCVELWSNHEKQYLKRQKTYFKKFFQNATWFDITKPNWQSLVIKKVQNWYNKA